MRLKSSSALVSMPRLSPKFRSSLSPSVRNRDEKNVRDSMNAAYSNQSFPRATSALRSQQQWPVVLILISALLPVQVQGDLALGLVAHWTLNDAAGTVAADLSGKNNKGVLQSDPIWTTGRLGGGLH